MAVVRYHTAKQRHGPVRVDESAVIERNHVVRLVDGFVVEMVDGADENLAVAIDFFPDPEWEEGPTAKPAVQLALLGEDFEVELPFETEDSGGVTQAVIGGGPYDLLAEAGGVVDLDSTTDGVFIPRRLGYGTQLGDLTGTLIGVVTDAAAF